MENSRGFLLRFASIKAVMTSVSLLVNIPIIGSVISNWIIYLSLAQEHTRKRENDRKNQRQFLINVEMLQEHTNQD